MCGIVGLFLKDKTLQPELGAKPRVYYKNMHLFTKCFVGGSVAADIDGIEECVEGAEVVLKKDGAEIGRATTDLFGEFKLDKLEPGSGTYDVEIKSANGSISQSFDLADESVYLGVLKLAA